MYHNGIKISMITTHSSQNTYFDMYDKKNVDIHTHTQMLIIKYVLLAV